MAQYHFKTEWEFKAPIQKVWDQLINPLHWPAWWKPARSVELITNAQSRIGSVYRLTIQGILPYSLTFDMKFINIVEQVEIDTQASGDLKGTGIWKFKYVDGRTIATNILNIQTTQWWINILSFIIKPVVIFSHYHFMKDGAKGLFKYLGVKRNNKKSL